jgi:Tol biopolymer transport system component
LVTRRTVVVVISALVGLVTAGLIARELIPQAVPSMKWHKLTTDNYVKFAPALTDGARVYFRAAYGQEQFIAQVPVSGGHPTRVSVTPPGPFFALQDLSPDGQELLLTATATNYVRTPPLWTLRIADGTGRRLGNISATSARYSADGKNIAWTTSTEVWVARTDGNAPRRLVELKGSLLDSVFWSPDGKRIRFSRQDVLSSQTSAWEIRNDGTGLRRVPSEWNVGSYTPSGWTHDGSIGLFSAGGEYWASAERRGLFGETISAPAQLTDGEPEFYSPVRFQNDDVFAIGNDRLGELQRYDIPSGKWVPVLDGLSAECAEYSPDGARIAYVTYPQRTLWVRQADGSMPIQLSSPPMLATLPRWSPDGKRLTFMAQEAPGRPAKAWIVEADGGLVQPAVPSDAGSQADPSWSPDGTKLIYALRGRTVTGEAPYIRVMDVATHTVSKLPGSDNLFSPRWSPDGSMLAALETAGENHLMVYRFRDRLWERVSDLPAGWPCWTADSKAIIFRSNNLIVRLSVANRKTETLVDLKTEVTGGFWGHSLGIRADGSPLQTRDRDSRQIYKLEFQR